LLDQSLSPVLLGFLIRHFSLPGDFILDLAAGSGQFILAALRNGRHALAFEQTAHQCEVIRTGIVQVQTELQEEPAGRFLKTVDVDLRLSTDGTQELCDLFF
jgi:DNA modification methylase